MKKQGFTLPELLITLAIIGVAAALLSPVFSNIIPDKNKVMILKKFNAIQNINNEILNNKELYYSKPKQFNQDLVIESCAGLGCTDQPLRGVYNHPDYSGKHKYVLILADMLGVKKEDVVTTGGSLTVPSETIPYHSEFKTVDGTIYRFEYVENNENVHLAPIWMYVTLKGSEAKQNKGFFSEDNKNPLMYKFLIKTNGEVVPADPLSVAYSRNPLSNNSRKEDRELAKQLANNEKINRPDEDNPKFLEAWNPGGWPGLPGGENPGGENPGGENPGGENPGGENPGGENPGGENPGGENPGGENPGGENPGGENPGGENPTGGGGEPSTPTDEPSDPEPSDPEPSDPVDPDPEPSKPTPSEPEPDSPVLPDIDILDPLIPIGDCSELTLGGDREKCKIKLGKDLLDYDRDTEVPSDDYTPTTSGGGDTQYEYIVCTNSKYSGVGPTQKPEQQLAQPKENVITIYIREDGTQAYSCDPNVPGGTMRP